MHTGLDRLELEPSLLHRVRGARLGLLAHRASVSRDLEHVADVLARLGVSPRVVFGPEHGYGGEAQDMIGVSDAKDVRGIRVRSLYGGRVEDLSPRAEDLDGLDLLLVDLQDVGARYYTFVWTAVLAVRACAPRGVRVMVLDRPNPLGGDEGAIEGHAQNPAYRSFVGLEPLPIRHGLTLGEIVAWRAQEEGLPPGMVQIVGVTGLERTAHATAWDRPFVMPSPNMPTYETALVYPGGCLLEGTNLSDGRGTTRPFEITGAPWVDGVRLAHELAELGLPGVRARPLTFVPTFHKHAGAVCGGVQVHVTDPAVFRPVCTYMALIALAHHQDPERFRFRTERYEFVDDIPAFDLLTGDRAAREEISAGANAGDVAERVSAVAADDRAIVARAREAYRQSLLASAAS
jgi:uncharacterized protein YbbC (DUF1343 family)